MTDQFIPDPQPMIEGQHIQHHNKKVQLLILHQIEALIHIIRVHSKEVQIAIHHSQVEATMVAVEVLVETWVAQTMVQVVQAQAVAGVLVGQQVVVEDNYIRPFS